MKHAAKSLSTSTDVQIPEIATSENQEQPEAGTGAE